MITLKQFNLSEATADDIVEFSDFEKKLSAIQTNLEVLSDTAASKFNDLILADIEGSSSESIYDEILTSYTYDQSYPDALTNFINIVKNMEEQFSKDDRLEISVAFLDVFPYAKEMSPDEITNFFFNSNGKVAIYLNDLFGTILPNVDKLKAKMVKDNDYIYDDIVENMVAGKSITPVIENKETISEILREKAVIDFMINKINAVTALYENTDR